MKDKDTDDEDSISSEEFVFGFDFSKLDVSTIEFPEHNDNDPAEMTIDVASSPGPRQRCVELISKSLTEIVDVPYDDNAAQQLFQWSIDLGANLDHLECRKDEYGGRGLYMSSDLVIEGDVAATLPRSLRIGQNHACRTLGLPKGTADLSALSLMIVNALDGGDMFAQCLPRQSSNAVFMTPAEQAYWAGCGEEYTAAIIKIQDQAKSSVQYIQDCVLESEPGVSIPDDSVVWWAIAMVQSRTHGFGSNKSRWMTPIFDFCNHSTTPNCRLEGDAEGNLTLKANHDIHKGEEITIDYQVPDDAKLVATYGFSLIHPGLHHDGN